MNATPVTLTPPAAAALPIVVDSPHSGTDYPADFGSVLQGLALRQGEDTFVHDLWGSAPRHGATLLAANFPRAYIDPNRSLVDIDAALLAGPWPGPVTPGRKTEIGIGLVCALAVAQIPVAFWERHAWLVFLVALALLVVVLVPGIGKVVNFSRRWIPLGIMNFQPSEFAKLAIAMYAASYMVRKMDVKENFVQAVWPMVVALVFVGVLLLRQPDMGAFIVIATIAMGILFLGGVNGRMFFLIAAVIVATFALIIAFDDLRRERILAYLDPWNPKYVQGKAYQLTHSLIAIGRGEIFGQGLGASVEKLHYLPEAHTDFLLAVIGEELGFIGVACVIVAFFWLTRRIFHIGRQSIALDRVFAGLYAQGIGIWFGGQAFINMGVNLGVLPTKGLTLPLMSYGGSAIVMNLVALAIVIRIDVENRQMMRGGRS